MANTPINWISMTDDAILKHIGLFIKETRISKRKTQVALAEDTGLSSYTISQIEKGKSVTLQVLLQILRALNALYVLDNFKTEEKVSPLEAVKLKANGYELAPLKMPLAKETIFSFPELRSRFNSNENTFNGLPGLLADVLPDRYGNRLINTWLAQQGRPADSMNPVEKLCFIGTRGMGALEFEPSTNKRVDAFTLEMDSLVNVAATMLNERERFTTNINEDELKAMQDILTIGTSAGGARAKAIIAYNETTGEVQSGQTISPKGFKHYLIKLDGVDDAQFGTTKGYGRIEMAYYYMATASGINMMPSQLLEENGRAHFITQRFDREDGNTKHHIQTLCAMKHFDYNEVGQYSYEQLFQTMRELGLPYPEAEQIFTRRHHKTRKLPCTTMGNLC